MNPQPTRSRAARTWRRTTIGAGIIAAVAAMLTTSPASAVDACDNANPIDTPQCFDDNSGGSGGGGGGGGGAAHIHGYGIDAFKILDPHIDFGDTFWLGNAPVGFASVQWYVPDCDCMNADVVGTLHLDGVDGHSGRIHVEFSSGTETVTKHSAIRTAYDNGHVELPVNLYSPSDMHVFEVKVCTESATTATPATTSTPSAARPSNRTDPQSRDRTSDARSGLPATNTETGSPAPHADPPAHQPDFPAPRPVGVSRRSSRRSCRRRRPCRRGLRRQQRGGRRAPLTGRSPRTSTTSADDTASTRASSSAIRGHRDLPTGGHERSIAGDLRQR